MNCVCFREQREWSVEELAADTCPLGHQVLVHTLLKCNIYESVSYIIESEGRLEYKAVWF